MIPVVIAAERQKPGRISGTGKGSVLRKVYY